MPALLNFCFVASWTLPLIFIPLIAHQYTDNLFLISMVLTLYNAVMLFSSTIFGRLGDTLGHKKIVIVGFIVSGVVFFAHNFIQDISSLYMIRGLAGLGAGMLPGPLAALIGKGSVGVFAAMGSFGFMISSILVSILQQKQFAFSASAVFCIIGFVLSLFAKQRVKKLAVPLFPIKVIKKNLNVYLPYLIRHSAATAIWAIFPIYLTTLGADKMRIGILYAINPLMQWTFMLLLDKVRSHRLISIGLVASACTFFGYAISPHWAYLLFLQALLGFSWANLYLGSVKQLLLNNPEKATATGILNSIFGLSGIIGPLVGGVITLLGMRALLFFSAGFAFVGYLIHRRSK